MLKILLVSMTWISFVTISNAWCGRTEQGDCYIYIRTGDTANKSLARGIRFVIDDDVESFGYIAATPTDTLLNAKLDLGFNSDAFMRLDGSGLLRANRLRLHKPDHDYSEADQNQSTLQVVGSIHLTSASEAEHASLLFNASNTSFAISPQHSSLCINTQSSKKDEQLACFSSPEAKLTPTPQGVFHAKSARFGGEAEASTQENVAPSADVSIVKTSGKVSLKLQSGTMAWVLETVSNQQSQDEEEAGIALTSSQGRPLFISSSAVSGTVVVNEESKVGIGTQWPTVKLDVNGGVQGTSAYSSASDVRYKKNIRNLTADESMDKLLRLQGVEFEWRRDRFPGVNFGDNKVQLGVIAQEIEKVVPEVVVTSRSREQRKSVQYASLVPLLIESYKALHEENRKLKAQVGAITAALTTLGIPITPSTY